MGQAFGEAREAEGPVMRNFVFKMDPSIGPNGQVTVFAMSKGVAPTMIVSGDGVWTNAERGLPFAFVAGDYPLFRPRWPWSLD
jgi:hypothetical protein